MSILARSNNNPIESNPSQTIALIVLHVDSKFVHWLSNIVTSCSHISCRLECIRVDQISIGVDLLTLKATSRRSPIAFLLKKRLD